MNKTIFLLTVFLSCLLVACGSEATETEAVTEAVKETEEETVEEIGPTEKTYKVGDTITTDMVEFKLVDFKLTKKISLEYNDDDFYMPLPEDTDEEVIASSKDGYVMAYISYTIQNIGKTDINGIGRATADGGSRYTTGTHGLIDIDWNDGYIFDGYDYCAGFYWKNETKDILGAVYGLGYNEASARKYGGSSAVSTEGSSKLKILSDPQVIRCIFSLPDQVEDESTPLDLIVYLPGATEDNESQASRPYTYVIR